MKHFEIHRDIRKKAMIFGLSIAGFSIQIAVLITSLLVLIFSFSFVLLLILIMTNILIYMGMLCKHRMKAINLRSPGFILSNQLTGISDEEN